MQRNKKRLKPEESAELRRDIVKALNSDYQGHVAKMAPLLGISASSLYNIVGGRQMVTIATAEAFARIRATPATNVVLRAPRVVVGEPVATSLDLASQATALRDRWGMEAIAFVLRASK